jgi:hypothetical protein
VDDPFDLNRMYGPQFYNRKIVYNTFFVYSPPCTGQQGAVGRLLGGWTFSTVFTAGSGQPMQVWNSGFASESFGEGDSSSNYTSLETEIPSDPCRHMGMPTTTLRARMVLALVVCRSTTSRIPWLPLITTGTLS